MNTLVSPRLPFQTFKKPRTWIKNPSRIHSNKTRNFQVGGKGFGPESGTLSKKPSENSINNGGNDDDDDKIQEAVWDRMIVRILLSVGTPMGIGIALLAIFGALKERHIVDFPAWVPFFTTLLAFGTSTVGIAYGTLSTSLDPDNKGSVLGWDEIQKNWPEMWKEDDESKR